MDNRLQKLQESADYIKRNLPGAPKTAIILGSSLGGIADSMTDRHEIDYSDVPHMLQSTVASHAGKFIYGTFAEQPVLIMSGRFHHYEGYSYEQLAEPVRILKLIGIETLIVTNAAGGVNTDYRVGDFMLIKDQIKLAGHSPMRGPNIAEFGDRFFDVTDMYTKKLRDIAMESARELGIDERVHQGVYYFCPGPQFETPAEIRAIRTLGGDAVGMSTVTEALTAAHTGINLLGISLITNMAAGVLDEKLSDDEVGVVAKASAADLARWLEHFLLKLKP